MKTPTKNDGGKTQLELMSFPAVEELGKVLTFGAKKYAAHNWREGEGLEWSRVLGAALRHLSALGAGQDLDPETGLPHAAHAMCCCMFLTEYQVLGTGKDDRWKP